MIRLAALAATVLAPAAMFAQVAGLPVVNSGVPTGVVVAADIGFPNDYAGGGTTLGAHIAVGLKVVGLSFSVSRPGPDVGEAFTSVGGAVTARLFGGPLVPFRVTGQVGFGTWTQVQTDVGRSMVHVPVSIGLAATIPNPAFAIKPWIAPRLDYFKGFGEATTNFGISGGIELGFLNGLSVRAAYDRLWGDHDSSPSVLSFGLGYSLGL